MSLMARNSRKCLPFQNRCGKKTYPLKNGFSNHTCFQPTKLFLKKYSTSNSAAGAQNYYNLLEISNTAEKNEIKGSFYRLSMLYHPDRNPNDEAAHQKFLKINEAYSVLSDEVRRKDYDRMFSTKTQSSHYFSNRFRQRPVSSQVRQYPSNVKFRPGSNPRQQDKPKFNNEEHQRNHYPESSSINNTPYRFTSRSIYNDNPRLENGNDVIFRMIRAVILIAIPYFVIGTALA